jgi:hypothetical protein
MAGRQRADAVGPGHPDGALTGEGRVATDRCQARVLGPAHLAGVVVAGDPGVPAGQQGVRVEAGPGHARQVRGRAEHAEGAQQRLAGDAGVIGALAAEQFAVDEGGVQAGAVGGVLRDVLPDGATAENYEVERVRFHDSQGGTQVAWWHGHDP